MNKWWVPSGAWPGTAVVQFPIKQVTVGGGGEGGGGGVGGWGWGGDNKANSVKMCPACFLSTVSFRLSKGDAKRYDSGKGGRSENKFRANRKSANLRT
jgi:hypothetical protein